MLRISLLVSLTVLFVFTVLMWGKLERQAGQIEMLKQYSKNAHSQIRSQIRKLKEA